VSNSVFITAFVGIQAGFIAADLVDRHLTRRTRYDGDALRPATVGFLLGIIALYLAIQVGLMSLAPRAEAMMSGVQSWLSERLAAPAADTPMTPAAFALVCVVAFYLGGLVDYLVHRFFNHSRPFWWTHEYHHLPNQVFVALPGLSVRPFSVFTAIPTAFATICVAYGVIVAAGWPLWRLEPLKVVILLNTLILTSSHSSFLRRWWWPHRVLRLLGMTTPQEHLVHHMVDRPGNYGNMVTAWDRLFGTYLDPAAAKNRDQPLGLGYDQDFLGAVTLGRFKLSPGVRERFQLARYCNIDRP